MPESDKSVKDWSSEQKFVVVLETAALNETQLAEYCRKKGLYPQQVSDWREQCALANSGTTRAQSRGSDRQAEDSRAEQGA